MEDLKNILRITPDDTDTIPDLHRYQLNVLRTFATNNRRELWHLNKYIERYSYRAKVRAINDCRDKGFLKSIHTDSTPPKTIDIITEKGKKAIKYRSLDYTPKLLDNRRYELLKRWGALIALPISIISIILSVISLSTN